MSHVRLFIGSYLQAVDGGSGENLTCFAAWFGVHGDGTMELWEKYWNIKHEKDKLARNLNYDIACIAGVLESYMGATKNRACNGEASLQVFLMWPLLSYTLFTSCACYASYPSNLDAGLTCQWLVRLLMCVLNPPSSDHFSHNGA